MLLTVVLVRHGETTGNRDGVLQGSGCDFPLTDKGEKEALLVGQSLASVAWDRVYSSDLPRTLKTTDIMMAARSATLSCEPCPLLREISYGLREGLSRSVMLAEARQMAAEKQGISVDKVVDTSETGGQVRVRQEALLRKLKEDFGGHAAGEGRGAKVLCVSHGGFIKRFLANFCDVAVEKIFNCSISVVQIDLETLVCSVTSPAAINNVAHIEVTEGALFEI